MNIKYKISLLLFLAVILIMGTGFLSYRSLTSIMKFIHYESNSNEVVENIKTISYKIEKAEKSIRIFTIIGDSKYLKPYYAGLFEIEEQIDLLKNKNFTDSSYIHIIDSLTYLIEEKFLVWNDILVLYKNYDIENMLSQISRDIDSISKTNEENVEQKKLIKRFFSKRKKLENKEDKNQKIFDQIETLNKLKKQTDIKRQKMEIELSETNQEITKKIYDLLNFLEEKEEQDSQVKSKLAENLSTETYKWVVLFSIFGTLMALFAIYILTRFIRKNNEYQHVLKNARQKAEDLVKAKEAFIASVSHELRTPMNAISGFTEQLLKSSEYNRKYLEIIQFSSNHLNRLINDILDYTKLQADKTTIVPENFDIRMMTENVMSLFSENAKEQNTSLQILFADNLPHILFGDSFLLKQIIMNLLSNAIKFTQNGNVTLDIKWQETTDNKYNLIITIKDNGMGIEKGKLDTIFEDFVQEDIQISKKYGGSGLGLAIVKKLVNLHGGIIKVKSKKDKGAVFTCTLPYDKAEMGSITNDEKTQTVPDLSETNNLIVDDSEYNRKLLRIVIEKLGGNVDEAESGIEALRLVKEKKYENIFIDQRMPEMTGIETIERIKKDSTNSEYSIYMLSAVLNDELKQKAQKSGVSIFLEKPVSEDVLISVILKNHKKSKQLTQTIKKKPVKSEENRINLKNLLHLTGDNPDFMHEMLDRLIITSDEEMNLLNNSVASRNHNQIAEIAHKLAPPFRHIEAITMVTLLKSLEAMSKENAKPDDIKGKLIRLTEEYEFVKSTITEYLEKNS